MSSCLNRKCCGSLTRKRVRGPTFELAKILFLKICSHATLFVRRPMTRSAVAMLSQKFRSRMSSPPPASRGVEHASAAVADAARPSSALAVGHRAAPAGGKFSSLQTLANKRNRVGIPPNRPTFRDRSDRLLEPKKVAIPRLDSTAFAENRRASGCGGRNFPIRKPLKTLEMAKESGRCRSSR
jgi:hypothetical protein